MKRCKINQKGIPEKGNVIIPKESSLEKSQVRKRKGK